MGEALYTFEAIHKSDILTLWLSLVVALAALAGMFFLLRKPGEPAQRGRRVLGAMLLFFVFLIAGSTAFFSNLYIRKLGPVELYASQIKTSYGEVPYENIRQAYIHVDKQPSLVNPNLTRKSTRLLVIEELDGNTQVLSEENYPIEEILGRMRELVQKE